MIGNTAASPRCALATPKIAITIDADLLRTLDLWVSEGRYPNRSKAIQAAVREKKQRWRKTRLAELCAMLDPAEEQAEAEVFYEGEVLPWEGE